MTKYCKRAFTLAEVLITLGVIGVVAALTLPPLIENFQKQQYVNQLKSGYTILNEGFRRMLSEEGVDSLEDTEFWETKRADSLDEIGQQYSKLLFKYFKQVQFIYSDGDYGFGYNCEGGVPKGFRYWTLGDNTKCYGASSLVFIFPNGMTLGMYPMVDKTIEPEISKEAINAAGGHMYKICGNFTLDVNGLKGPNQWGRDVFDFILACDGRIHPTYGKDQYIFYGITEKEALKDIAMRYCNPDDKGLYIGISCAARIIEYDNWQMKY